MNYEVTKQAMLFAAGLGTRLRPLTDTMPKALVPVCGKPLLWHVLQKLKAAGYRHIVVNVHHFAQQIIDYLKANDNFGLDIRISDESEALLDTGGGIRKALPLFDPASPILIHNVDILSNLDIAQGLPMDGDATLVVSQRQTKRYLLFDDDRRLCGWTNIETGEVRSPYPTLDVTKLHKRAFAGIHQLAPTTFPLLRRMPDRFGIIDFYLHYCDRLRFLAHEPCDLRLLDIGKLDTLSAADDFINNI